MATDAVDDHIYLGGRLRSMITSYNNGGEHDDSYVKQARPRY